MRDWPGPLLLALVVAGFKLTSQFRGLIACAPLTLWGALKCLGGFLQFRLRGFDAGLGFGNPDLPVPPAILPFSQVSSARCSSMTYLRMVASEIS
jgi:hypothetical protein